MLFQSIIFFILLKSKVFAVDESCSDPGVSPDGSRRGRCCSPGHILTYSCKKNYELVGHTSIICLLGGNWTAARPRCRPSDHCPDPPTIENGLVTGSKAGDYYSVYDEVEVICNPGFSFHGENKYIFCHESRNWDVEVGECRRVHIYNDEQLTAEILNSLNVNYPGRLLLYFVFDVSRSIHEKDFNMSIKIAKEITKEVTVSKDSSRVGALTFGSETKIEFLPMFDTTTEKVLEALDAIQFKRNSGKSPSSALQVVHEEMIPLSVEFFGRRNAKFVVYIFTDGKGYVRTNRNKHQANLLKEGGVQIFCIGITNDVRYEELYELASPPPKQHVFILNEYKTEWLTVENKEMDTYNHDAVSAKKEMSTRNTKPKTAMQKLFDLNNAQRLLLYFAFDMSETVKNEDFKKSIRFAKALTKKVGVSKDGAQVGALSFSSEAKIELLPFCYRTTQEVLDQLDKIKITNDSGISTKTVLQVIEDMIILSKDVFKPENIKPLIFIFTDGKRSVNKKPIHQAKLLKEAEVEIYCIGVTDDVREDELHKLASLPTREHVFILNDYETSEWLTDEVSNGEIDYSRCGLGARDQEGRRNAGEKAIYLWPWMAALYYKESGLRQSNFQLKCGGSVISKQWVLTAAHCVIRKNGYERPTSDVKIKLGLTNVDNVTNLQEFEAAKFVIHPNFSKDTLDYDVALIKLDHFVEYNPYIRPVCLPPKDLLVNSLLYNVKHKAFATGWGHDGKIEIGQIEHTKTVKDLKEMLLPLQERESCLQTFLDLGYTLNQFQLTERMFCAGKGDGSVDICFGDGGGPLMQSQTTSHGHVYWTQIGIISSALGCRIPNTFGIYTNVHNFVTWIKSETNEEKN